MVRANQVCMSTTKDTIISTPETNNRSKNKDLRFAETDHENQFKDGQGDIYTQYTSAS